MKGNLISPLASSLPAGMDVPLPIRWGLGLFAADDLVREKDRVAYRGALSTLEPLMRSSVDTAPLYATHL